MVNCFVMSWRRGSESNRRIKVLQTLALPLGYRAASSDNSKIPRRAALSQSRPPTRGAQQESDGSEVSYFVARSFGCFARTD
jgi:hypothetical protein